MKAAFNVFDVTSRNKSSQHVDTQYLHQVDFFQSLKFNKSKFYSSGIIPEAETMAATVQIC